jgi:phosphate transport system substrate-binding protein
MRVRIKEGHVKRAWMAAFVVGAVLATACGAEKSNGTATGDGKLSASLTGAGSTFINPAMLEWIKGYQQSEPGVKMNYQAIGSGGGIEQFIAQSIDFGASDAFMKDDEIKAAEAKRNCGVLHIPMVFGAVVVAFNEPGLTSLTLDGPTLANIFLGKITTYDDPAIKALNPGATLPSKPITIAHRSDGSGTTKIFTNYLSSVSPEWKTKVGADKEVKWPVGVGGQGNDGIAAAIKQNTGGLGYVELSYALENNLTMAALRNADGNAITPSLDSTGAAVGNVQIPADLRFTVANVGGQGYPIVGATWVVAYECGYAKDKAESLKSFLTWALQKGDDAATQLKYETVGADLEAKALAAVEKINSKD